MDGKLAAELEDVIVAKTVILGMGNILKADDGFGPELIRRLKGEVLAEVFDGGMAPENYLGPIAKLKPDVVIIADAVDFGEVPGSVKLLGFEDLAAGDISTHNISLKAFVQFLKTQTPCEVHLLAVQPKSIKLGEPMSDEVKKATSELEAQFKRLLGFNKLSYEFERPILACGGELKNTICLGKDSHAYLSQQIGDLKDVATLARYEAQVQRYKDFFQVQPEVVACDMHPEYLSTKYAQERAEPIKVQHHHAHIASCMAENGLANEVIGVAFDGTGYGLDAAIWGGEFFVADFAGFERAAHFEYLPMPGGEMAIREPWRMAAAHLFSVYKEKFLELEIEFVKILDKGKWRILERMISRNVNCPLTSSTGRLFDAVSALCCIRLKVEYEAQAAIELQQAIEEDCEESYDYEVDSTGGTLVIKTGKLISQIVDDLRRGEKVSLISAKFHNTMARIIAEVCAHIRDKSGINKVALSGGVFQNGYLFERALKMLSEKGFETFTHRRVSTTDAGISLGQAVVADARCRICV